MSFTATTSASTAHPWKLNATTYATGVTTGNVTGVTASISGSRCTATVAGTTATVQGRVASKYTNSTRILKVSGGNLPICNVSSDCLGLINTGDPAVFIGSYTIKPAQTITGS